MRTVKEVCQHAPSPLDFSVNRGNPPPSSPGASYPNALGAVLYAFVVVLQSHLNDLTQRNHLRLLLPTRRFP